MKLHFAVAGEGSRESRLRQLDETTHACELMGVNPGVELGDEQEGASSMRSNARLGGRRRCGR
jgi:hypothetical protein